MMGDTAQHAQAAEHLWKTLDIAAAVGADGVLIVPGGMNEEISVDSARRNCIDFLKQNKAEIERRGIFVGVENVWNGFFLSPYDMVSFIDEVNSPLVGAYLDVGNMIAFSEPEYWVEVLGSRIGKVHVKDYKREGRVNSGGDFVDITHGTAKWEKIIPGLRAAGYDGYLVGEVFKEFEEMSYEEYYAKVAGEMDAILVP